MNITFGRVAIRILFLFACPWSVWAQLGTVDRNVILRRDPSTASLALEHLPQGTRVTLVDATPDSGFYHVRTEDDQVGWVWSKYVSVSQAPTSLLLATPGNLQPTGTQCDASLWNHVYHSQRLIVKQQCISVTGTIVDATNGKRADGVRHEKDGDTHGWLNVEPEFQNLLNAGNMSDEGGNLVFEIVCRFPVTQTDAKSACQGFKDQVKLPPVGSHVRIVGTYVQDTFHAQWMEIHPVTNITVIP
jgi:Bacterial SH3 domain